MSHDKAHSRWMDRQVPEGEEIFLDHTGHFVGDLEIAARSLRRLGFEPSSVNLQTNVDKDGTAKPSGTSNCLVRFRRGFLEILAATHDTPIADQLQAARSRYDGLHLLAFSHADLNAQRSRLVDAGVEMQAMVHMRRYMKHETLECEVAWSVLRTLPDVMPEGRIQYVYPHTPALSWPPGSMEHPNVADSLTGALLCVADPKAAQARFGALLGRSTDSDRIALDRGVVRIFDLNAAAKAIPNFRHPSLPYIAAVTVASADLTKTRSVLAENGVPVHAGQNGTAWIGPEDALGSYLCFHEFGSTPL